MTRSGSEQKSEGETANAVSPDGPLAIWARVRVLLALLLMLGVATVGVNANGVNRAGLVVVHGDGRIVTRCIDFAEPQITGIELLQRSGLDLNVEASGMGATVCALDGAGCSFPQQSCFCQCEGAGCVYWSYWRWENDGWRYAQTGAANSTVLPGSLEGWVWGAGSVDSAQPPPGITFAAVCAAPTATATATALPTALPSPTPSETATALPPPAPPTSTQSETATALPPPAPPTSTPSATPAPLPPTALPTPTPSATSTPLPPTPTPVETNDGAVFTAPASTPTPWQAAAVLQSPAGAIRFLYLPLVSKPSMIASPPTFVSAAVQTSSPPALLSPPMPMPIVAAGTVTASESPTAAQNAMNSGETAVLPAPLPPAPETAIPQPRAGAEIDARLPPQPAQVTPTLAPVDLPAILASPTPIVLAAPAAQEDQFPINLVLPMLVGLAAFAGLSVLGAVGLFIFWLLRRITQ